MVQQALRSFPLVRYNRIKNQQETQEESRLISTLRMHKKQSQNKPEAEVRRATLPLPLSSSLDTVEHETSQSRWLKENDKENKEILIIEPMLPGGQGRRKSIFTLSHA